MSQREINIVLLTVFVFAIFVWIIMSLLTHLCSEKPKSTATEPTEVLDELAQRRAAKTKEKRHA